MEIKVSLIDNEVDFFRPGKKWNALLDQSASQSIFLTWEWVNAWWKSYRRNGDRPFVLLAEDEERLVGMAPLFLRKIRFAKLLDLRALSFIGDGTWDSDYLDFVIMTGRERQVINEFFRYLIRIDLWDLALLNEIPAASPTLPHVAACAQHLKLLFMQSEFPCAYTPLPGTWQNYLASLRPRFRTKVRSTLKMFEKEFGAKFERYDDEESLTQALETLFDLHGKRWALKQEGGVFGFSGKKEFYGGM